MKLYWRMKKNGKWTWKPAKVLIFNKFAEIIQVQMEEEE